MTDLPSLIERLKAAEGPTDEEREAARDAVERMRTRQPEAVEEWAARVAAWSMAWPSDAALLTALQEQEEGR